MANKRRALVIENEAVRHPFRRLLPAHVLEPLTPERKPRFGWFSMNGWRDFLMAYCAMFMAVSTFIA